jgi:hypothetical protein
MDMGANRIASILFIGAVVSAADFARGQGEPNPPVNLEWRPQRRTVAVGDLVEFRLYAASTNDSDLAIANIEAILQWDETALRFVDRNCNGPYNWLACGFPPPGSGADRERLNDDFDDGDLQFLASRRFPPEPPFFAPPQGRLVASMVFEALRETPLTIVESPPFLGENLTRVLHGFIPGKDVTGEIASGELRIVPEPATGFLLAAPSIIAWGWSKRQRARRFHVHASQTIRTVVP